MRHGCSVLEGTKSVGGRVRHAHQSLSKSQIASLPGEETTDEACAKLEKAIKEFKKLIVDLDSVMGLRLEGHV